MSDPIWGNYQHRDSAIAAVKDFCRAQGSSVLKQGDESTDIKENPFSIKYASDCKGSGSYTISEDTCVKYLTEIIDSYNTDTTMYKHGGTVTDQYGCVAFAFQPTGVDSFACYPTNKDANYITQGRHAAISPEIHTMPSSISATAKAMGRPTHWIPTTFRIRATSRAIRAQKMAWQRVLTITRTTAIGPLVIASAVWWFV